MNKKAPKQFDLGLFMCLLSNPTFGPSRGGYSKIKRYALWNFVAIAKEAWWHVMLQSKRIHFFMKLNLFFKIGACLRLRAFVGLKFKNIFFENKLFIIKNTFLDHRLLFRVNRWIKHGKFKFKQVIFLNLKLF